MNLHLAELVIFLKGKFRLGMKTLLFVFFLVSSCEKQNLTSLKENPWELISARDQDPSLNRPFIYRISTPNGWTKLEPDPKISITNTTFANCEFVLEKKEGKIRLTIHTFPFQDRNLRIPPQAQVNRWKQQFDDIDILTVHVSDESRGGFSGLFFEAEGLIKGQPTKVMAWSMQIAQIYDRELEQGKNFLDSWKRADYTIKASGPIEMMTTYRKELIQFSNSFELIDELRIAK